MYNDMNNEQNNEPNFEPILEVDNEANLHPVNNVANNEEDEEPVQIERRSRRVHRCSSSAVEIPGTSEVRPNVTEANSDNAITWVIPGAESYTFGMGGSKNLVEDELTSMIYKGKFFPSKKDLKRLVGHFALRHNFEWNVKRSNKSTLHLIFLMDNCTWKLRAVRRGEATYFQVRSFVNEHTCPLEEIHRRHRQASAVIIGEVVTPRLQQHDGRLMRPRDIIVNMKIMYGIQIMYSKAYQALDYVLSLTYGTGFRRCLCPVIAVDGTHLKGRFGGTMFVATAQDGNEQVYPIAFGYGDSENNLSWKWFLDCSKAMFIRNMLQRWFHDRHIAAQSMNHQLTDAVHLVILKCVEKCNFITVNPVDWNIFYMKRSEKQWTVDPAQKTCTCNKFQMDQLPCYHALAADRQTLIDSYSVPIIPVGHPSNWVVPSDIIERVVLNPISRRQAGRPRAGRYISSSEKTTTQNYRRCGQPGHNSRRYSNQALINEGPSRVVSEEH
ncbi:hypothetical protein Ddye_020817 [Dipteronia dyeriana]|uniref:SWIM-type domain-containing protein n=1 Tax=Dipteronia dyeriana TaxID=168575 RepID=A0AAD9U0M8_9ROSI|nr:hypothetical protein Ddye_020817 [Dipteronia dyeriana]